MILASDKTHLTASGRTSAWPVYLTIGNIPKTTRRQASSGASILLGYLPVAKLECCSPKLRTDRKIELFHKCLSYLTEPLIDAGKHGVDVTCADGMIRRVFPILAAYVGDYPEQCLVACCSQGRCPRCTAPHKSMDQYKAFDLRDPERTLEAIRDMREGIPSRRAEREGIKPVQPFWEHLPHTNVFTCITPDLLHQIHRGVFKDHVQKWSSALAGIEETNRRYKAMPPYQGLRYFKHGITREGKWTGAEVKEMERVYLGAIANAVDEDDAILAVRHLLDFTFYAHFELHSEESIARLEHAWSEFHRVKAIFLSEGVRDAD